MRFISLLAQRLYEVYKPITKTSINVPAGVVIDPAYDFITTSLSGEELSKIKKGGGQ
jgi:hypothetical protein